MNIPISKSERLDFYKRMLVDWSYINPITKSGFCLYLFEIGIKDIYDSDYFKQRLPELYGQRETNESKLFHYNERGRKPRIKALENVIKLMSSK